VNDLLIGLVSALVATNQPAALSNLVERTTGVKVEVPNPNDPVEQEFRKLLELDDQAQADADRMIRENEAFAEKGTGVSQGVLKLKLEQRLAPVKKAYEDFLQRHPTHNRARIAYASFLSDLGDETGGRENLERALQVDPNNAAAWNNLANYHGHNGPVKRAFECYEKAIAINPSASVYHHNYGTTVYLFRKDAMEHFKITEQQVFDKALALYRQALQLDPRNFPLATDVAKTYYGIKPERWDDAILAWNTAFAAASDDLEREGVRLHFGRIEIKRGNFDSARAQLNAVTNALYNETKELLLKNLAKAEAATNGTPALKQR
jgi:tetratricopeptide (TPR) repeat protein